MKKSNSTWSTKLIIKHLQKKWRGMTPEQTKKYRDFSATDRARFDRQRKILKEGISIGQVCQCQSMTQKEKNSELNVKEVSQNREESILIKNESARNPNNPDEETK